MTWSAKTNSSKILIFFPEKKLFKISDTKIFIFFGLNQPNILMYSKIEYLQKYAVKKN